MKIEKLFTEEELRWIVNTKIMYYDSDGTIIINGEEIETPSLDTKSDAYIRGAIQSSEKDFIEYYLDVNYESNKPGIKEGIDLVQSILETTCIMLEKIDITNMGKIVEPFCGISPVSIIAQRINNSETYAFDKNPKAVRLTTILGEILDINIPVVEQTLENWAITYNDNDAAIIGMNSPDIKCARSLIHSTIKANCLLVLSFSETFLYGHPDMVKLEKTHNIEFVNTAKNYIYRQILIAKPKIKEKTN